MKKRISARLGFSLVEVAIAVGLVSFSMLILLGLLAVGLDNVRQSVAQVGTASIARQVRSDLQQLPLTGSASIQTLNGQSYYYSEQGIRVANAQDGYFQVTFAVGDPTPNVAGAPANFGSSAANVTVTLTYPMAAPATSRQTQTFSLLEAGQ